VQAVYLAAHRVAVETRLRVMILVFMEAAIKQALTLDYLTTATHFHDHHPPLAP
jgi:hypothetical protein